VVEWAPLSSRTGGVEIAEGVGLMASWACAVHCALTPVLVSLLPMIGLGTLLDERVEWLLVGAALALGVLTLVPGYRRHHRRASPLAWFAAGAVILLAARLVLPHGTLAELPLAFLGAVLLTAAQLGNARLRHVCPCEHGAHEHLQVESRRN